MPDQIFLTIVTNDPDEAIADALCCAMTNKPKWVRVVSDPIDVLKLPNGTKCVGLWYSGRKHLSGAELAWRERRMAGGLEFLTDDDHRRIASWIERNKARMRGETVDAALPSRPQQDDKPSVLPHPQPELQNLILSQRWT
ncbi:hypothetical protein ABK249_02820 [Neorhizobium sp. Rsf11]|uniref:Uncharacterized protein n=1 Tax=Neorhizobium phenanthreniclasticum TaxID=3157917 RepID=A0ABV0LW76_9HYPH